MLRTAKPYPCRGSYVTNLGGKRQRLCPQADGLRAAREIMLRLQREHQDNGGRPFPGLTVVELVALFLDTVKVEKAQDTYAIYQRWLTEFAKLHGGKQARAITRPEAQQFKNDLARQTWVRNMRWTPLS